MAAVLLADDDGRACLLLTRRAATLRSHTRQWALPGGRLDPGETAEGAALRELREEVGLALDAERGARLLDDYPTRSGYVITPVVVWAGGDVGLPESAPRSRASTGSRSTTWTPPRCPGSSRSRRATGR